MDYSYANDIYNLNGSGMDYDTIEPITVSAPSINNKEVKTRLARPSIIKDLNDEDSNKPTITDKDIIRTIKKMKLEDSKNTDSKSKAERLKKFVSFKIVE